MKEENSDQMLSGLEARITALENRIFGDEIRSKTQQQRKVKLNLCACSCVFIFNLC